MTYIKQRKAEREIVFLSFADTRYAKSLERLKEETEVFPFTTRLFLTEKDLPEDFRKTLQPRRYPRGYGYWKWKPFVVDKVMDELKNGDILVYSDGGTHFEKRGMKRFNEYLKMTDNSESGIVMFQQPFLEKDWAKGDLLNYCGMYNNNNVLTSLQLWGGVIVIKINNKSRAIIKEWADLCLNHFHLISDKRSKLPNAAGFVENRHDQAALSLTLKKYPHVEVSWQEVEFLYEKDKEKESDYPIQAKRTRFKEQSIWRKVKRKLLKIPRYIWALYLRWFEGFHFAGRGAF